MNILTSKLSLARVPNITPAASVFAFYLFAYAALLRARKRLHCLLWCACCHSWRHCFSRRHTHTSYAATCGVCPVPSHNKCCDKSFEPPPSPEGKALRRQSTIFVVLDAHEVPLCTARLCRASHTILFILCALPNRDSPSRRVTQA